MVPAASAKGVLRMSWTFFVASSGELRYVMKQGRNRRFLSLSESGALPLNFVQFVTFTNKVGDWLDLTNFQVLERRFVRRLFTVAAFLQVYCFEPICTYLCLRWLKLCNARCPMVTLSGLVAVDLSLCVLPFVIVIHSPSLGPGCC